MDEKYNRKNPAVKRILQEVKEMQSNPFDDYMSLPLEENIFEWQFAIRGPRDSEFEGGIYHGRIQLPADYPFQPPSFMMLTPSWSVRTALVALIAFMPTKADGALGSLEYTKEERHALAIKSRETPPKYGNGERQKLIDEIHEYMLSKVPPGPPLCTKHEKRPEEQPNVTEKATRNPAHAAVAAPAIEEPNAEVPRDAEGHMPDENVRDVHMNANAGPLRVSFHARFRVPRRVPEASETSEPQQRPDVRARNHVNDRWLTWLAIGQTIAIVVLILKKYMKSTGLAHYQDEF